MAEGASLSKGTGGAVAGPRVLLRPVLPVDVDALYRLSLHPSVSWRWRYRGTAVSPEEFAVHLRQDVLVHFVVERRDSAEPIGYVVGSGANHRDGWAYVAALGVPTVNGSGLMVEATALLVGYLFSNWTFRKLYFDVNEYNLPQFASALQRYFSIEGQLKAHVWNGGRYWDTFILSVDRSTWEGFAERAFTASRVQAGEVAQVILTFDEFLGELRRQFPEQARDIDADSHVLADLGFDSLDMFELLELLDTLTGEWQFREEDPALTVRDIYRDYCIKLQLPIN